METSRALSPQNIEIEADVPPSGGSLEIGNAPIAHPIRVGFNGSPFGGIPRNWKRDNPGCVGGGGLDVVPPSGGSLEIGNFLSKPLP